MTTIPLTRRMMPAKARMQYLLEEVSRLEAKARRSTPIEVLRIARCGHAECGAAPPVELPADALVLELGCIHDIPPAPPPEETELRTSRLERAAASGAALTPERKARAIKLIKLL